MNIFRFRTAILIVLVLCAIPVHAEVSEWEILPSATDPAIKTFDTPHKLYFDRRIVVEHSAGLKEDRKQLLLWLPGTRGSAAKAAIAFCKLAADSGYHVISLMYPDEIPATVCQNDDDPAAFETFRMAIIRGGDTKHITIARQESIENRLIRLLKFAETHHPDEGWGRFLTGQGELRWDAIAVAGQSQGGGHAALLGIKHSLARLICTGAPKDYSKRLSAPAAWYHSASATPKNRFFVFNHRLDPVGCSPDQLTENLHALGLDAFGKPVDAADQKAPFPKTRIFTTSYPPVNVAGPNSEGAKQAHTSVIANTNAERWADVWTYMLTAYVE